MGLDSNSLKILFHLRSQNFKLGKTLTLGRQEIHISEKKMKELFDKHDLTGFNTKKIYQEDKGYCETLLRIIGADEVISVDASNYENATIIHDMNQPIPNQFKSRYNTIIDGGTLEHVFNFPIAIKNCMELLRIGGHYLGFTPTNNFLGHGFYQFSPEIFFRVFSENNGFRMISMLLYTEKENSKFYEVMDPLLVKERVILTNIYPSYLFIHAEKISNCESLSTMPQQSDYVHIKWHNPEIKTLVNKGLFSFIKTLIPNILKHIIKIVFFRCKYLFKMIFYEIGNGKIHHFKKIAI